MSNILNHTFNTPYTTAPFSQIKNEDYLPAIEKEIQKTKSEIDVICNDPESPTFENTIEALEFTGEQLDRITSIFFNLNSAETNEEIQKLAQKISPLLSEFGNDIRLNEVLFDRIKKVWDSKDELSLNGEQSMLLEKTYKSFSRNGANLPEDKKVTLREIDAKLSKLSLTFGENVLAETNAYTLHITDKAKLKGLPESAIETALEEAKSQDKEGWVFTLNYPSYIPMITYVDDRNLRKEMALAFGSKAFKGGEHDNQEIIKQIVQLRQQRAALLGFKTHADFVLEERMAKSPEKVNNFLEDLLEKAKPAAQREFNELQNFAKETHGIEQLQKWDSAYYTEKLKQQRFDLDDEKLKPYFKLENVIQGVFTIAGKLYGLQFEQSSEIDAYHTDVKTYKVLDENGELKAIFYADFHPRPGKRNGAWMTVYKRQFRKHGIDSRPHISIVCNFTKPTATKPSLLTFNEVTTLFHEFGHALHGMLANTTYPSLSGTSVYWDFVELPSQVMENWCFEKEALELFAKHYQTGEVIPMEYVKKIKESSTFMEGMQTVRQLSFGILDMSWHGIDPKGIEDVKSYEEKAFQSTNLFPQIEQTCMSTSFSHIFQGGYSSGYYSYKWAEVLDADAFEFFKEKGIFSKEVATKFKNTVLSQGGTQNPMDLYKQFRGQEPQPEALLRRAGLLK
ncbi:M3 family metallopeptidase [Galbibacter sp.]|jgi:peptidyl-dipeptidase Dcp|uniref:M3 family metallopeptidase n=1 Tax=Galbibacter sp. TaxID=2918471 RepID=UPI003A8DB45D